MGSDMGFNKEFGFCYYKDADAVISKFQKLAEAERKGIKILSTEEEMKQSWLNYRYVSEKARRYENDISRLQDLLSKQKEVIHKAALIATKLTMAYKQVNEKIIDVDVPSSKDKEPFRITDLPLLTSEATIDLDNMLSNKLYDRTNIIKLGNQLKNFVDSKSKDPPTLSALSRAIIFVYNKKHRCLEELYSYIEKIVCTLLKENLENDVNELTKIRDFCVAISQESLNYRARERVEK